MSKRKEIGSPNFKDGQRWSNGVTWSNEGSNVVKLGLKTTIWIKIIFQDDSPF